ncbi:uncharacterized protein SCHCODRAFT_01359522 [Schizophyllum commune H4-8]|nr:uncharacterized protein SCHCODRAFT_01359522 [Schizophyllum commune H4-8]KAI5888714.1 hypothetical protein SCHCODRAFT_01359522 [Schizophyllum commune H4-8]
MPAVPRAVKNHRQKRSYAPLPTSWRFKCKSSYTVEEALALEQQIQVVKKNGARRYICPSCDKDAAQKTEIEIHVRTHTKLCRYFCPQCDYKGSDPSAMQKHCKNIHGCKSPGKDELPAWMSTSTPLLASTYDAPTPLDMTAAKEDSSKVADIHNCPANAAHFVSQPPPPPPTTTRKRRASSAISPPTVTASISRMSVSSASLAAARLPIQPLTPPVMAHQAPLAQDPYLPTDASAYQQVNTSYDQHVDASYGQSANTNGQPIDTAYVQPVGTSCNNYQHTNNFTNQFIPQIYNCNQVADACHETPADIYSHPLANTYHEPPPNTYYGQPFNTHAPSPASSYSSHGSQVGYQPSNVSTSPVSTSMLTPPISMPVPTIPTFSAALPPLDTSISMLNPMPNTPISMSAAPAAAQPFRPRRFSFNRQYRNPNEPVAEPWANTQQLWNEASQECPNESFEQQWNNTADLLWSDGPQVFDDLLQGFDDSTYQQCSEAPQQRMSPPHQEQTTNAPAWSSSSSSCSSSSLDGSFPSQPLGNNALPLHDVESLSPYDPSLDPMFAHLDPDALLSFWVNSVEPVYRLLRDTNALPRHLTEQDLLKFMLANN